MSELHLPSRPPVPAQGSYTLDDLERFGIECMAAGVFNERAAVLVQLDYLAREFDAAGKPNTAKKIRDVAAKIDARLRDGWR